MLNLFFGCKSVARTCDFEILSKYCIHHCDYFGIIVRKVIFNPYLVYSNQPPKTGSYHRFLGLYGGAGGGQTRPMADTVVGV